jgi:hypothetical protein
VDGDARDEIVFGACVIDDNGKGLYSTGIGHGDAMHLGDLDPDRPGLEVWQCHEGGKCATLRDAGTGTILFQYPATKDVGRACAGDVTAATRGCEMWAAAGCPFYTCTGTTAGAVPSSTNFVIWWDGDRLRELLDGTTISKYGGEILLNAGECASNNGTKSTPCLTADIFGDWREEVVFRTSNNTALRIYTTTSPSSFRMYTLMHDPQYRLAVAWQNVAYNQPPHPGFYLGDGMNPPPVPYILTPDPENPPAALSSPPRVAAPERFFLEQNFPNPFNPETEIRYRVAEAGKIRLTVHDLLGRPVRTLADGFSRAGVHSAKWDGLDESGRPLPGGLYLYRIQAESTGKILIESRKMLLLK